MTIALFQFVVSLVVAVNQLNELTDNNNNKKQSQTTLSNAKQNI